MSRCGCQSVGMGMLWCKKHSPEGQRDIIKDLEAENQRLREALEVMLQIYDRDLPEKSIGRKYCDEAKAALEDK